MSAAIYRPPEEVGAPPDFQDFRKPDGNFDIEAEMQAEREWVESVQAFAREHGSGDLAGEIFRWQMGDGYAQYVVYKHKPLELIHLPVGDAWDMPDVVARGLRVSDVRQYVVGERKLAELFGRKETA